MNKHHRALAAALLVVALVGGVALASAVVDQVVIVDGVSATIDVRVAPGSTATVDVSFRASSGTIANTNQSDNAWIEVPASYTIDGTNVVVGASRARDNFPVNPSWPHTLTLTVSIDATDATPGYYNLPLRAHVTKGNQISSSPGSEAAFLAMIPEYIRVRVAQTYTVTYDGNGATGGTTPVDPAHYEEGQSVTVLANTFTKTGHVFVKWNTQPGGGGQDYVPGASLVMGTANVTLYAIWAPVYTVTYHGNENTAGTPPVDSTFYKQGDLVTALGPGTLAKDGFNFVGWNTEPTGIGGTAYAYGAQFPMGTANVNLYAQWANTYVVVYHGNGNTAGTAPVDPSRYAAGVNFTVLGPGTLAKGGYTFAGWNTHPEGTGTNYAVGYTGPMGAVNLNLYARWTPAGSQGPDPDEDVAPAAPAIANELLRAHGISHKFETGETRGNGKGNAKPVTGNYISEVAKAMGKGASFPAYSAAGHWDGVTYIAKSEMAAYAAAVRNFLVSKGAHIP